ncbi:phosphatase and actin regulator 4-like isoform X2 [Phlebotomus papatasi]|uniref:phosphatase and actin regulator 4-like isoform X2 n=1 Tax=Phlebotomus papatasi TaxID=29031 RepID=UPI0024836820|nr:phosphatase and actin regulator 4-like isoform X2 [Phlebotomus papatasi]
MVSFEAREQVPLHFVAICSLGALLSMIAVVMGIKLRWFRHRLNFDRLPTAPKRDSTEDNVVVTGFYRKSFDFDNFIAIERPQSLPPIRLDKRPTQRNSHLMRNTILTIENSLPVSEISESTTGNDKENTTNQTEMKENAVENATVAKKKAPRPPKEPVQAKVLEEPRNHVEVPVQEPPAKTPTPVEVPRPPRISQAEAVPKKRGLFSSKSPESKNKVTKKKKDRPSVLQENITSSPKSPSSDKILAESTTFAPVIIPRNPKPPKEPQEQPADDKKPGREVKQLQFAPDDEIIGQSDNYDSWDLVSKHRQSLNHLSSAPAPKPRPRDSVAYHRQKALPMMLDLNEDRPPKTLREMHKEREKLSISSKEFSDTEA